MPGPTLRLFVCGALGRMGGRVIALAKADPRFSVVAGVARDIPDALPPDSPPLLTEAELGARLGEADMVIDFSSPEATARLAALAAKNRTPLVTGVTGLGPAQQNAVAAAARRVPVFQAPNFSPGMTLLLHLAKTAALAVPAWDAAVVEAHHAAKKDAPSGSAKALVQAAKRPGAATHAASVRAGDIVGDHTLFLAGPCERLELTHRAHSRDVFARGALEAAWWLRGKRPGLYGMDRMMRLA